MTSFSTGSFRFVVLYCLTLANSGVVRRLDAQTPTVVRGDSALCNACGLALTRPITLRVPDTTSALFSPFVFRLDARDRVYFNDPFGQLGIRVFAPDGRYLRTIGRRGQAPGEFIRVDAMEFDSNDTLHVYGNAHWVFDPEGHHQRSTTTPSLMTVTGSTTLRDGTRILIGSIDSPDRYGQPFHILDATGAVMRSFGLAPRSSSVGAWANLRIVAAYGPHGFLSLRANAYEIEFWSADGKLDRVVRRDPSWFPPWTTWNSRSDINPPPPRVMSAAVDDSGFIWILISVADAHWKRVATTIGEGPMMTTGQMKDLFDSIIEIIDPRSGLVVASTRFPEMLLSLPRPGVAIENIESADGEVQVRVWKVARSGHP